MKKKETLIALAVVCVLILGGIIFILINNNQAKVDTDYLNALVKKSSELTTAKLKYKGMTRYTDEGINIINKADFIMVYDATIRAGIDLDQVNITADDKNKIVYIDVPKAKIIDVNIDTSSIEYFDQGFALFNTDEKEDNNKAIAMAREAAMKDASEMGILELADGQSETLIKGILSDALPDGYVINAK